MNFDCCTLCKKDESLRKGSHVIPMFIISNLLSKEGKARDKEIGGTLSSKGFNQFTIGRDVSIEMIEELFGRELDDEDLKSNTNPFIFDYFLCNNCENRLGRIEDLVATEFYQKIKFLPIVKMQNGNFILLSKDQNSSVRLFFLSILWRASITNYGDFSLPNELNEKIRIILDSILSLDKNELKGNLKKQEDAIKQFTMCIIAQDPNDNSDRTENFVNFDPDAFKPYFCTLNEFIIGIYSNNLSFNKPINKYLGVENIIYKSFFKNEKYEGKILVVSNWQNIKENTKKKMAKIQFEKYSRYFSEIYLQKNNQTPTPIQIKDFMDELINGSDYTLDKYSVRKFAEVAIRHM
jgi:hypothetical protein